MAGSLPADADKKVIAIIEGAIKSLMGLGADASTAASLLAIQGMVRIKNTDSIEALQPVLNLCREASEKLCC